MKRLLLLFSAAALTLTACQFHFDSGYDWSEEIQVDGDDLRSLRADNRRRLSRLDIGMSRADVDRVMGRRTFWSGDRVGEIHSPYDTSAYVDAHGREIQLLYYYTEIQEADGFITRDELTPVVLADGRVIGWGTDVAIPAESTPDAAEASVTIELENERKRVVR